MGVPIISKQDGSIIPPYTHNADGTPVLETQEDRNWNDYHQTFDGGKTMKCLVPDHMKPMIYKGQPHCSDTCRKLQGTGPKDGYRGRNAG